MQTFVLQNQCTSNERLFVTIITKTILVFTKNIVLSEKVQTYHPCLESTIYKHIITTMFLFRSFPLSKFFWQQVTNGGASKRAQLANHLVRENLWWRKSLRLKITFECGNTRSGRVIFWSERLRPREQKVYKTWIPDGWFTGLSGIVKGCFYARTNVLKMTYLSRLGQNFAGERASGNGHKAAVYFRIL